MIQLLLRVIKINVIYTKILWVKMPPTQFNSSSTPISSLVPVAGLTISKLCKWLSVHPIESCIAHANPKMNSLPELVSFAKLEA